jgi:hypothetical protein
MHLVLRGLDQVQRMAALKSLEAVPGVSRLVYFPRTGETTAYVWDGLSDYAAEVPG